MAGALLSLFGMGAKVDGGEGLEDEDEVEAVKLGDGPNMKRVLDEVCCALILDEGYAEKHDVGNAKAYMGSVACVFALLAQFWPGKFPANYVPTAVCVGVYILLNAALTVYTHFCEGEVVLFSTPEEENQKGAPALVVTTRMARFSDVYRIQLSAGVAPLDKPTQPLLGYVYPPGSGAPIVDAQWRVGELFDVDGCLDSVRIAMPHMQT